MRSVLKFWGLLLVSMTLVMSCGKDDKPDKPNDDEAIVTTVDEMIQSATWVLRVHRKITGDELKNINDTTYLKQLKDLVTKDKNYKKIVHKEDMSIEKYTEITKRKYQLDFFDGVIYEDENYLGFCISSDGKKVTVLTHKLEKGDYFELEDTLDIYKIEELVNKAPDAK